MKIAQHQEGVTAIAFLKFPQIKILKGEIVLRHKLKSLNMYLNRYLKMSKNQLSKILVQGGHLVIEILQKKKKN